MKSFIVLLGCLFVQVQPWEDPFTMCPNQCTCQHQPFVSSSQSRWIDVTVSPSHAFSDPEATVKSIMCIVQNEFGFRDIVPSIPSDVQAMSFLFTGATNQNITEMHMSDLVSFHDLVALEVRGVPDKLRIVLDAPLERVLFVNFEAVDLLANDHTIRRPRSNYVDPADTFSYMPNSEAALYEYNSGPLELEEEEDSEIVVVPYEQYKKEIKKSAKPTFYGWSALLILRLHNCHQLDQLDAEVFDDLTALVQLSLSHNRIKVIPAFAFYGMAQLRTLSLAHNEILNLHYRDLAGLLSLRHLDLSYNNLTKLTEATFPPMPQLESLDLRYNGVRHIFAYTFDVMNDTRTLHIGDPEVQIDLTQSINAFDSLHELRHLQILNASHPRFSERIFAGLRNLHTLRMHGSFRELTFDAFGSIGNVTEMTLTRCGVEQVSMDTFYGLEQLQVIDLSHNRLAYLPPNLFDRQFKLRELYLHHNRLAALPHSFFAHTRASVIRLTDNPWVCTCAMLRTWRQGVTNARIKRRKVQHCQRAFNEVVEDEDEDDNNNITNDDTPLEENNKSVYSNNNGRQDMCREKVVYETVYDNKLSPRCEGGPVQVKNRAVYYAFRRDLKCPREEEGVELNGRLMSRVVPGVGNVTMKVSKEAWARAQHVKKVRIMLARKKEVEKQNYRHTNSINTSQQRLRAPYSMNRWKKLVVVKGTEDKEDQNELSNRLE